MEGQSLTIRGDIGPLTGEVHHEGDISVIGSVWPGYVVVSGGDLVIHGNVDRARAQAGGDLTVMGLVAGKGAVLDAVGSVCARQVSDARVLAGLDIEIRVAAERSVLAAGRKVLLTGRPGLLRGGKIGAGLGVEANRVEAGAGQKPSIRVGRVPFDASRRELADRLAFALSRIEKTKRALPAGNDIYRRQVADLATYRQLARRLTWRLRQLDSAQAMTGSAYVQFEHFDPLQANLAFGDDDEELFLRHDGLVGAFQAVLEGGEVTVNRIQEKISVG